MEQADFWNNQKQAQATVQELKGLKAKTDPLKAVIAAGVGGAVVMVVSCGVSGGITGCGR